MAERFETEGSRGSTLWGVPFVAGLLVSLLGVAALLAIGVTSMASVFVFGFFLIAAAILEIVFAFAHRREQFTLPFLSGLLTLVVGVFFVARPVAGLAALGLLLSAYFFAAGLFHTITSAMDRYAKWGWHFFFGLVSLALGVLLLANWPLSSVFIVGLVVGLALVARGISIMGASLVAREMVHAHA